MNNNSILKKKEKTTDMNKVCNKKHRLKKTADFIVKNRKSVIVVCCISIICTAVYVDWKITSGGTSDEKFIYTSEISDSSKILGEAKFVDNQQNSENIETSAEMSVEYFTNAQMNRKRSRDESVEMLRTVVDSSETMPDVKDQALQEMMKIANDISKEASIEEMIKAKGFSSCIAVISGDNINVIVQSQGLLANEVAQIKEIVMNESEFPVDNIKIVEKY